VQTDGCYSASCKAAPAAVPSRLGCPSPIKHIFLIVRENRTCDQVFGHNWLMQADANDYIEKEFGAFYRSYPPSGADALAYQRDGFLWNAAEAAGQTVKSYGEYNNFLSQMNPVPSWPAYYKDSQIMEGKARALPIALGASCLDRVAHNGGWPLSTGSSGETQEYAVPIHRIAGLTHRTNTVWYPSL